MSEHRETPSTAELVDVLQRAVGLVRTHFAAATARLGVTPAQARALGRLATPLTPKDLSLQLGADLSNTASVVDRLEALGLVRKEIHPSDRRARLLTLTDRGEELRKTLDREVFGDVPALAVLDEAERKQLYGLLRRVTTG
ncbi:MarR family winged helix-turn-helix transcriptional regulator [Nocardia arthritidis]|uniref:MarR family winged helix-turn-helix transcriptional regulator n=1 Tax=Nocardia arthritidis TaxID=228602 RepID=UPI0007A55131|nr:MarR family transcriptional regulator [Nocardia arthritidis]